MKTAITIIVLTCLFSGCVSYKRCKERFGERTYSDTTYNNIVRYTPKDSLVLTVATDTTTIYRVVESGKTKIIYDRTNTVTRIQAECKPDTVTIRVPVQVNSTQEYGVKPAWKWATVALGGMLILCGVLFGVSRLFTLTRIR